MSYNYLPLDRKWLSFQQVKNLLDYDQLVSITFDAHERILTCHDYIESISGTSDNKGSAPNKPVQKELTEKHTAGSGEEVPADIVKLMLMLKIKSLSFGQSGVQIETVKRLMEMYDNAVLPVIYTSVTEVQDEGDYFLRQLTLPLLAKGEVYYKGQKQDVSSVVNELNWQPLTLQPNEKPALTTGTHFISAHGLYVLKQTERLLKIADIIAAVSLHFLDCPIDTLHEKINGADDYIGQANTAKTLLQYLEGARHSGSAKQGSGDADLCNSTKHVHGAAGDSFQCILKVFLKEINSVTEDQRIFPDEGLVLNGVQSHPQPLILELDYLAAALAGVANLSVARTRQLLSGKGGSSLPPTFISLLSAAVEITTENKELSVPSSVNYKIIGDPKTTFVPQADACRNCLQVIGNLEKVLAMELVAATCAVEDKGAVQDLPALEDFMRNFRKQVLLADEDPASNGNLANAMLFLRSYNIALV
jgi:histidine ammonia-lyase